MRWLALAAFPIPLLLTGCETVGASRDGLAAEATAAAALDLQTRFERIRDHIGTAMYGPGGPEVLAVAHEALRAKHASGEALAVGIEDLWTHALQEGSVLFNQPDRRWGHTTAEETGDMIGQTTIGPWQMTVTNIQNIYGPRYGVQPGWTPAEVNDFCREHPEVQAMMIADYIDLSYALFGRRTPYAIQRYFWLEPYVRGEIGQAADWTRSPVARPPEGGTWQDLTDDMRRDTGFYAKQVLLGHPHQQRGLIHWLLVTGDEEGARDALRAWRDQPRLVARDTIDSGQPGVVLEDVQYVETSESGGFVITPDDVRFPEDDEAMRARIRALVEEVAAEVAP